MAEVFILKARFWGGVQGVGFRFYCQRKALELGLNGFVRNEKNSSVYVEAIGEKEKLENLSNALEQDFAIHKTEKSITKYTEKSAPEGFEIRY